MIAYIATLWRAALAPYPCKGTHVRLEGIGVVEVIHADQMARTSEGVIRLAAFLFGWPAAGEVVVRRIGGPPDDRLTVPLHEFMSRQRLLSVEDLSGFKDTP